MKCVKCNNELRENDKFCSICGTPVKRVNEEVVSQNTYTYERPIDQRINSEGQFNNPLQQNNNYGQTYDQVYTRNRNVNNINNANNTIKICVIIIIALIVFAFVVIFGAKVFKSAERVINEENNNTNSTNLSDSTTNGQGGNITSVSKAKSYKVTYNGFRLYIPDTLVYTMDYSNKTINIGDTKSTWIANFEIDELPFQTLKQNKNILRTSLMQANTNANISEAKLETIGGVEYIVLECNLAGEKEVIGIAELNSMNVAIFELRNENNDFDRENIKNLSSIISTAEYIGESSYIKSSDDLKITGIDKALEAAKKGGE